MKYDKTIHGYDDTYDARYVLKTGEWLDPTCGDKSCPYCMTRPEKHSIDNAEK